MARIKLLFLPSKTPSTHKSKHEQELEVQEARAHAASIAHHRAGRGGTTRTGQQREQQSRGGGGGGGGGGTVADPMYSRWLLPVVAVVEKSAAAKRHPRDLQDLQQQGRSVKAQQSQGLAWIKTGPLDPFLQLPVELDIKERNMLFYYLDTTPRVVHGVKKNPVYCPVRECTVVSIADSPLFLQWIIFMAEMMTGASKTAIYARRAAIYAETRKVVKNPANLLLDTTLLHLVVASLAETRLGNVELADKHFAGLLQLLRLRNGLRTFQEIRLHLGLGMVHAFVVGQVPLFRTREEILDALGRMSLPRAARPVPPSIRRYFAPFCFSGAHIGNLHMLNMIMAAEPDGFMDRLVYNITGSGETLTPVAMTFMIGQSAVEVGEWFGPNPLVRSWETIEFVRLLAHAIVSREATATAMSSWLTGAGSADVDLEALKAEILDEWDMAQALGGLVH